ncbi:guanine nucleotide-binding protein subunit beta-like protein 1 [Babesia caballi]|uniref:Guanine nucleotide-binding protein subunit beta-like protein 1 n=1 Tax=Babesia caballi TaxID=5871 RepID=A0AAV4LKZ1_BABCB|nr:guanine nucleotide-binding protein subunit beta-like protein 1 [Babesia caballi]
MLAPPYRRPVPCAFIDTPNTIIVSTVQVPLSEWPPATMFFSPCLTIRSDHGLTSVRFLGPRLLTTSSHGDFCSWSLESANLLSSSHPKPDLVSALPLLPPGSSSCGIVALQHKGGVCLFDLARGEVFHEYRVDYSGFSRIRFCRPDSPLLLCPSGLGSIVCHDLRLPDPAKANNTSSSPSIEVPPPTGHGTDVGTLQNFEPIPSISAHHVASTYESGLVAVSDLRRPNSPVAALTLPNVEGLPSLDAWRSVLLVGDTSGHVSMLHVSPSSELTLLRQHNVNPDSGSSSGVGCLKVRPDGALTLACCWDYALRALETRTLQVKATLKEHYDSVTDAAFDGPTGRFATCGLDGNAHVWNLFNDNYSPV